MDTISSIADVVKGKKRKRDCVPCPLQYPSGNAASNDSKNCYVDQTSARESWPRSHTPGVCGFHGRKDGRDRSSLANVAEHPYDVPVCGTEAMVSGPPHSCQLDQPSLECRRAGNPENKVMAADEQHGGRSCIAIDTDKAGFAARDQMFPISRISTGITGSDQSATREGCSICEEDGPVYTYIQTRLGGHCLYDHNAIAQGAEAPTCSTQQHREVSPGVLDCGRQVGRTLFGGGPDADDDCTSGCSECLEDGPVYTYVQKAAQRGGNIDPPALQQSFAALPHFLPLSVTPVLKVQGYLLTCWGYVGPTEFLMPAPPSNTSIASFCPPEVMQPVTGQPAASDPGACTTSFS